MTSRSPAGTQSHRIRVWLTWLLAAMAVLGGVVGGVALKRVFLEAPLTSSAAAASFAPTRAAEEIAAVGAGAVAPRPKYARRPDSRRSIRRSLTQRYAWPEEPEAPLTVDPLRFRASMVRLCGHHPVADQVEQQAEWVRAYSASFGADPFLLGAVIMHATGCGLRDAEHGVGLTALEPSLYEADFTKQLYWYRVFDGSQWRGRNMDLSSFLFRNDHLALPEANIYFAAAFLRAWREQARGLRAVFPQGEDPRHYVSHFVWGDEVPTRREEDWILVERRRLLEYYGGRSPMRPVQWRGFRVGCPLDGCPRVVTSNLGDEREGGKRRHRGVDFESTRGEPVRAIADGVVIFAGVDLPGKAAHQRIPIYAQRSIERSVMGAGGLYVCVRHAHPQDLDPLMSCYMHLESATVSQGRTIKLGDEIGRVGRSGIQHSAPHLHFEIHARDGIHAATEVMPTLAMGVAPDPDME